MSLDDNAPPTQSIVRDGQLFKLRSRMIRVAILAGPDAGKVLALAGPRARIGSGTGCELLLDDPTVSRHHLTLRVEEGGLRVVDERSRNGTVLDGVRVLDAFARPDSTIVLGSVTLQLRLVDETVELPLSSRDRFGGLMGRSVAMRRLYSVLERIAPTDNTVLIEGETGTGKELVAEAIHDESPRAQEPFIVVDCSAISASLVESELFGHVRGAFTGAVGDREGAFEAADGGTLFLDEVGELSLELQPKLLRALERQQIRRVGSNTHETVNVRVIAATNRNLAREVERGRFREDLFYRLDVVRVTLPPLRERSEDIPLLAEHFAAALARAGQGGGLSRQTLRALQAQAWPGNVRELRNAVARALSLGSEPPAATETTPTPRPLTIDLSVPLKSALEQLTDEFTRAYLEEALQKADGNVTRAAELAGVNRKFIQRALRRLQVEKGE
jgi:transcriptional regulator with GAF, ATPase, and Fis domain